METILEASSLEEKRERRHRRGWGRDRVRRRRDRGKRSGRLEGTEEGRCRFLLREREGTSVSEKHLYIIYEFSLSTPTSPRIVSRIDADPLRSFLGRGPRDSSTSRFALTRLAVSPPPLPRTNPTWGIVRRYYRALINLDRDGAPVAVCPTLTT